MSRISCRRKSPFSFAASALCGLLLATCLEATEITLWYGTTQHFGRLGHPQRWINILGSVADADDVNTLTFSLNGGEERSLSFREDFKRIARDGDFNVEIDRMEMLAGENQLQITASEKNRMRVTQKVTMHYHSPDVGWPLPYSIEWNDVSNIQDVVQVVDGKWKLTSGGIRSVERYYDRVVALGDESWRDYDLSTTITVHKLTAPRSGSNKTNVTHAAIALRWPGHDEDGNQPSVKWHPLGATAEFRLGADLAECRWRIFDGKREYHVESAGRRKLQFEKPYRMRHRVVTMPDGRSRYRAKLWPAGVEEPQEWDLERFEKGDLPGGSALLIAHHADVTFGDLSVVIISSD